MWKYCGNISQLEFFIFYIISHFFHFISSIRFFFLLVFLLHTRCPISIPPSFIFFFSLIQEHSNTSNSRSRFFFFFFFFSPALSLYFFFFLLDSKTFIPNEVQMSHLRPKAVGPAYSRRLSSSPTQSKWVRWLLSSVFCLSFFFAFIVMIWLILKFYFWVCILII